MQDNIANKLTLLRGLMVPVLVVFFLLPGEWSNKAAAVIVALAALTDFLDGVLARGLNQETKFGAYLDQAMDKVLVVTALLLILYSEPHWFILIPALVTVIREFVVLSLRDWLQGYASSHVAVNWMGKFKTTIQYLSLVCIFWAGDLLGEPIGLIGLGLLYLATLMTLLSGGYYFYSSLKLRPQEEAD